MWHKGCRLPVACHRCYMHVPTSTKADNERHPAMLVLRLFVATRLSLRMPRQHPRAKQRRVLVTILPIRCVRSMVSPQNKSCL